MINAIFSARIRLITVSKLRRLGSDHLTSRGGGGGGGFWSGWNILFTCFQRQNFFFQHHRGLKFFFLPMYDARSNFFLLYCSYEFVGMIENYIKVQD